MSLCQLPENSHHTIGKCNCGICLAERISKLEIEEIKLKENFKELENKYNDLLNFKNVAFRQYENKPHKCPVCNGKGSDSSWVEPQTIKIVMCNSCEGKGIVWG